MSEAAPALRMTVPEFLRWDDGTDTRYELVHGQTVAMSPPADRHGTIAINVGGDINSLLQHREPCRAVGEGGIWVDDENYYVADVVATCASPSDRGMIEEPFLIVEVISPSNEKEELATKAQAFIKLPLVQELWFIDSRKRWVQLWQRMGPDRWLVTLPLAGSAEFDSPTLKARITLDRLYRNTGL